MFLTSLFHHDGLMEWVEKEAPEAEHRRKNVSAKVFATCERRRSIDHMALTAKSALTSDESALLAARD